MTTANLGARCGALETFHVANSGTRPRAPARMHTTWPAMKPVTLSSVQLQTVSVVQTLQGPANGIVTDGAWRLTLGQPNDDLGWTENLDEGDSDNARACTRSEILGGDAK